MAKGFTGVTMPGDIALDPVQSEIWKELAPDGNNRFMRKNPALSVLKEASAEIRALSDQLGVSPRFRVSAQAPEKPKSGKAELLELAIAGGGRRRAARA